MSKILGRAEFRIDGQYYDTSEGAKLTVGGQKNTAQAVGTRVYHTETLMPAKVECQVPHTAEVSMRAFQNATGVTVTFRADTGQTYIIRDAVQTGDVAASDGAQGGLIDLVFEGQPAEEMV